jgi:lipooligosaccharide transport system permease protein
MVWKLWYRSFKQFQETFWVSLLWVVVEPLFTLGAIGFGLGTYVSNMDGVSYADFFFPALLCVSGMFVGFFVGTYDNFSKLTHERVFATQILTPVEPEEIVWAAVLWGGCKGLFSGLGITLIAAFFGLIDSWRILPALVIVFLISLVFTAFGMFVTTLVKNYDEIIYPSSGLIIPMSLFSGTYFPVEHLPYGLKYLAYLLPLTHGVRTVRNMLLTGFDWWMLGNISFLVALLFLLVRWSTIRLTNRLLD